MIAKALFGAFSTTSPCVGGIADAVDDVSASLGSYSTVLKTRSQNNPPQTVYVTKQPPCAETHQQMVFVVVIYAVI